jgi:tetratricopeptide (TPR) repeat protein
VEADPKLAKAHAALSRALLLWTHYEYVPAPSDAMQRAEAHAHQALALDPDSSEAHAALGTVLRDQKNKTGAASEYQRALELNPNNAAALWDYGVLLSSDPATERAAAALRNRLARIDPRSPILWQSRVFEVAKGGDSESAVRREVAKATDVLADDAEGLRLVGLAARVTGHAEETYRVCVAIARAGDTQSALFLAVRAWLLVDDFDRAQRAAEKLRQVGDATGRAVAGYLLQEIAGLKGDFKTWDRIEPEGKPPQGAKYFERVFWLSVQGRYQEAARDLERLGPPPESAIGGLGAGLVGDSQLLPALLRTYRATGRVAEADSMAQAYLERLRRDPDAALDLAALAANEGLKDEAVHALRGLFNRFPLIDFFHPELPWFKSLDGHPGYEQLMTERKRRIVLAHEGMLQLEAAAAGTALGSP